MSDYAFYQAARFVLSATTLSQLPPDRGLEVAFAGRSNAGKSSVLNVITQQNNLARTSKTPGRTQQLNVFTLAGARRLIDLPGYGYAKVSQALKKDWQQTLDRYLQMRQSLTGIILIMDVRHPLKPFDQMMLDWSVASNLPIHILLNKADKLKKMAAQNTLQRIVDALPEEDDLISVQLFSALKKRGVETCYQFLNRCLQVSE